MESRQYIVIARTTLDDLPLRAFIEDHAAALEYAKIATLEDAINTGIVFGLDFSTVVNIAIVAFIDGIPTAMDIIRNIEDDEQDTFYPEGWFHA